MFCGSAVLSWLTYLMIEPYARANWPRSLVSWNRLLQGRWRDPMVGRDLLLGVCAECSIAALFLASSPLSLWWTLAPLQGTRHAVASMGESVGDALSVTFMLYVVMLGLHRVFRLRGLAVAVFLGFVPSVSLL